MVPFFTIPAKGKLHKFHGNLQSVVIKVILLIFVRYNPSVHVLQLLTINRFSAQFRGEGYPDTYSGGSRISRRGHRARKGRGANSRRGNVFEILYVKPKESGEGGVAGGVMGGSVRFGVRSAEIGVGYDYINDSIV